MPTQIRDLKQEVLAASELKLDSRWKQYVKWIDAINPKLNDGYSLVGGFICDGTVQVDIGKRRLLLACAESGSAKYRYGYYKILILEEDGSLTPTDIEACDEKRGWALRIREPVQKLLDEIGPVAEKKEPVEDWRFKLSFSEETYKTLAFLQTKLPELTYDEIAKRAFGKLIKEMAATNEEMPVA